MQKSIREVKDFIIKNFSYSYNEKNNFKNENNIGNKKAKSKSGFILMELCIGALILAFIVAISYSTFSKFIVTSRNICDDMELFRVKRTVSSFLRRELTSRVDYITITKNYCGSVITCYDKITNKEIKYYRGGATSNSYPAVYQLYLQRKVGNQRPGKNPLLPPSVDIKSFEVKKLNENTILIEMELFESTTKRERNFSEVITSCNIKMINEIKEE